MGFLKEQIQKLAYHFLSKEKKEVVDTLTDYAAAFMTFVPENVLGYFELPMMFLSDDGPVLFHTREEVHEYVAGLMKQLKDQDYARDDLSHFHIKSLSPEVVITSFHLMRIDRTGASFGKFGATYTWRKTDGAWKLVIAVLISH